MSRNEHMVISWTNNPRPFAAAVAGEDAPSSRRNAVTTVSVGEKKVPSRERSPLAAWKSSLEWTSIASRWAARLRFDQNETTVVWCAYGYTSDKDVARAAMKVEAIPFSVEQ